MIFSSSSYVEDFYDLRGLLRSRQAIIILWFSLQESSCTSCCTKAINVSASNSLENWKDNWGDFAQNMLLRNESRAQEGKNGGAEAIADEVVSQKRSQQCCKSLNSHFPSVNEHHNP